MTKPNTIAPLASGPKSSVIQLAAIGQQQQPYQLPLAHQPNNISDDFANSLISELKTIKLGTSSNAAVSADTNAQPLSTTFTSIGSNDAWSKQSMWAPHSPATSIKTQYHSASSHTASKESLLWQSNSTQSSPHNVEASSASSTTSSSSASLWENPGSTMSLMHSSSDQSFASIWNQQPTTPPQVQSPGSKLSTMWSDSSVATPNSAYLTDHSQSSTSLLLFGKHSPTTATAVPTGCDIWSQAKDPVGSLWTNPTPNQFATPSTVEGTISKQQHQISSANDGFQHTNHNSKTTQHANNHLSNSTAASSCLQLFSDEFQNYLNMIN